MKIDMKSAPKKDGKTIDDNKKPYRLKSNPKQYAWYTIFFIENHLDHHSYPDQVASLEQIGFMVYTTDEERYYPCSDQMFEAIMNKNRLDLLQIKYSTVLNKIFELIDRTIEEEETKRYLKELVQIKYRHETRDEMMIPSRLEKRLLRIFLSITHIEDPCIYEKTERNKRIYNILNSEPLKKALNHIDKQELPKNTSSIADIRGNLEHIELKRLLAITTENLLWESEQPEINTKEDFLKLFSKPLVGDGVQLFLELIGIYNKPQSMEPEISRKILWIANESGEIVVDLAIIKYLIKLGHKIIISVKEDSFYTKSTFKDVQADTILTSELEGALFIKESVLSKNGLLRILKRENHIFVISDGTREDLNLMLASTTFARTFKEVDFIVSRGSDQKRRFFDTHFKFTRDIFNIATDENGAVEISLKIKHPDVIRFSYKNLEDKAKSIIKQMEEAKNKGMTVIFYSGVIGSIPGKIDVAKKIMTTFIEYLHQQMSKTFIINPSQYYEPGMDADDLMYMWEIVQRSGFIDIWRFQTYEDILRSFKIMRKKVPPEWVGKDATYSTGCTKEMRIAIDVLNKHPEMQIIGPDRNKFMRRNEYGIGKMYDQRLS